MEPIHTLGRLLTEYEPAQRDAIHIAIMPVMTDEALSPGDHVKFVYGTTNRVRRAPDNKGIGVVDPFLTVYIPTYSKVWMFLYPNTITGLRHEWTHPDVDNPAIAKDDSEKWLRAFADRWNFDYNEMINAASTPHGTGEYDYNFVVANGIDLHSREELGEDHALFWQHLAALTKQSFSQAHIDKFRWSCSC